MIWVECVDRSDDVVGGLLDSPKSRTDPGHHGGPAGSRVANNVGRRYVADTLHGGHDHDGARAPLPKLFDDPRRRDCHIRNKNPLLAPMEGGHRLIDVIEIHGQSLRAHG